MCGIGLIVSGVRIDLSCLLPDSPIPAPQLDRPLLSIEDIKAALERRGPDSSGSKDFFLHAKAASCLEEVKILSSMEEVESTQRDSGYCSKKCDCGTLTNGESYVMDNGFSGTILFGQLHFIGATLQLRGINPIAQPLVDTFGNILVYNGEVFGGILVNSESNDAEVLMESLRNCCTCSSQHTGALQCSENGKNSVPELLSTIKGPWALIYWQESSKTIWFGRDAFGRRSLLVRWPTSEDSRFLLSSVAPSSSLGENFEDCTELNFWEELSCGVYSISTSLSKMNGNLVGEAQKHQWSGHVLAELIEWNRISVEPKPQQLLISREKIPDRQLDMQSVTSVNMLLDIGHMQPSDLVPLQSVLSALRESVRRRSTFRTVQTVKYTCSNACGSPVAVLFSGGLDSMILAALLDECLDPKYDIDLLNVSFDGESAPDRMSAKSGLKELKKIAPSRRWKLVEIDADLSELTSETKHVMSLINPAKTYMDLNIGIALWLAAGGDGWISENKNPDSQRAKYKSESRILLVGSGADEQCAGYGRHRTKYREGSWARLNEEMKLDMQRIWKRNLGRDDRCIADNGKEARFPYLDEDVIRTLLAIPLWEIADLDQPSGIGDKKILREVAQLLGLHEAAVLPKRAIQFGSRIARESNRKNFGSNRAANQASAGTVVISMASNCY